MLINPILSDQLLFTTSTPTFKDLILSDFSGGNEPIAEILDETINRGVLAAITVTDGGNLNITWSAGEIWDSANLIVVETTAEATPQAVTNNSANYLKWVSGTALTLNTTFPTGSEIGIARICAQDGDIVGIIQASILNTRETEIALALGAALPVVVISGMVVEEDVDATNALDIKMSAGIFYAAMQVRQTPSEILSRTVNLVRHFHTASAWDTDTNAEIDTANYDNGTSKTDLPTGKWVKSAFHYSNLNLKINWIYPDTYYTTQAQAIAAPLPEIPPGLAMCVPLMALVYKTDDTSLPTAGGEQWVDIRPQLGAAALGTVTDHGGLAGLGDDDHAQYTLHSLADAANDFLVASGADTFVKKTLAETGAILEGDIDHGNLQGLDTGADHSYIDQDVTTSGNPQFATVELGHATDTTLTRVSGGVVAIEGTNIAMVGGAHHDGFSDFVADEHVAHSGVTITAGTGLTGTHDIATSFTLAVDGVLEDLDTLGANSADSEFLVGTGAGALAWENAATSRTSMGVAIGTDVLAEQTIGIADDNLLEVDDASAADGEYARFTANGLEGVASMYVAVSAQTLTAGDAIVATDGEVWTQIDSAGAITLTSEPHIAAGRNGQVIRLHNTGSYNIILQDVNSLGGSLMRFDDDTVTIEPAGTLELVYDSDVSFWVQTASLNPQSFTPSISSFTANLGTTREVAAAATEDSAPNFTIAYVGTPSACSIDVSAGGDPAAQWPIAVPSPYTALNAGTTPTTDTFYRQTTVAATRVFTATATVAGTGGLTATITYTYYNRRYVGPSSDGAALTTAEILALDDTAAGESGLSNSKYGTFTDIDTAAGEYIYYCYRSALGTVSHFSIENEIAAFTDEGTAVTHTNDQGFAETFQQYRSDNTNFGANKDFRALSAAANNRIFCGPHTDAQIDDSGILEIDDTADGESIVSSTVARTYTDIEITGSEYLWLCHPDRVSDISTIKDGTTGFAIAGEYKTNVSHTNQYGYTETYRCWRSDEVGIYPTGENVVVT